MSAIENLEERISEAKALAKSGNVTEALESLLALEKSCRLAAEVSATVSAASAVIDVCMESKDWKLLNDHILIISKRRSQLKQAISKVVQMCFEHITTEPCPFDYDSKIELIETLRAVSAGKLYVEIERARLTRMLSKIREDEGKIKEASEILQQVAPETHGTMDRLEKVDFILEQMRLSLAHDDFVRAGIIANKINEKNILDDKYEEVRSRYHKQMIQLYHHQDKYLAISKSFHALYSSPSVAADESQYIEMLQRVVVFVLLAPYDNEQSDFVARIKEDKKLENIPLFHQLVTLFVTQELISWPLPQAIMEHLSASSPIWDGGHTPKIASDLHTRVVEHNIRVVSRYYSCIPSARLAHLLDLSIEDMEAHVSRMVCGGVLYARIDRVDQRVQFKKREVAADSLNKWAGDLSSLLAMVEDTCHLIRKENVVHAISN